jgi:hypothetical protein
VEKRQALATTSPTQSVLLAVVGIQTFKEFVQLLMAKQSAKMFVHHALRQEKQFVN